MKLKTILCSLLALGLVIGTVTTVVAADKKYKLEAKAKISKADAQKTALAKVPGGKVVDAELEKENGKLVWSFDIATDDSKDITEVQVDAITGEVVSVAKETPADQEKEKQDKEKEKQEKK